MGEQHRAPESSETRAREALIATALADCQRVTEELRLAEGRVVQQLQLLQTMGERMQACCHRVEHVIDAYNKTLHTLDNRARERFSQAVVAQTHAALDAACAQMEASATAQRAALVQAAVAGAQAALRQALANPRAFARWQHESRPPSWPRRAWGRLEQRLWRPFAAWLNSPEHQAGHWLYSAWFFYLSVAVSSIAIVTSVAAVFNLWPLR
jgi:hypothetical protein